MSSNTATASLASNTASTDAAVVREKAVLKCQSVLESLYDSHDGYKACAADCKDTTLTLLFQKAAATRADFIAQLANAIRVDMGSAPVQSGSTLAAAHRTWIDVKSWFTDGRDRSAIIAEVHRGEAYLILQYEAAIQDPDVNVKVRDLLHAQLKTIKEQDAAVDAL
jgi:uncharacterized protein (TIGR02284 family)